MLSNLEYEWLTGWKGPPGAAYNQIYEFLCEDGIITRLGTVTPKGAAKIEEYRQNKS